MRGILFLNLLFIQSLIFSQTPGAGVTDIDGNYYSTIIIGSQEWMAENLRVSKFSNGNTIPNITDNTQWFNLSSGAWAYYNNDNQYDNPYGKLYNWFSVSDSRNVCPTGWHIPSDEELIVLTDFLGGESEAGGKMKSSGTQNWLSPNTDATNESGFSALPSGARSANGTFNLNSSLSFIWSSTEIGWETAWCRTLYYNTGSVVRAGAEKKSGQSIRCIKSAPLETIELFNESKKLLKIVDLMGREIEEKSNTILIYVYMDGTIERKFIYE